MYQIDHDAIRSDGRTWTLAIVGLGAVSLISYALFSYGLAVTSENFTRRVREQTFYSVVHHSIGWFQDISESSIALSNALELDACKLARAVGPATTDKLRLTVNVCKSIIFNGHT